jgi:hypothetical protein
MSLKDDFLADGPMTQISRKLSALEEFKRRTESYFSITDFFVAISVSTPRANNAAALLAGLKPGDLYRTGGDPDVVCVVH